MSESLIHSALFRQHGLVGAFTTRTGGFSQAPFDSLNFGYGLGDSYAAVTRNYAQLASWLGLKHGIHGASQVHEAQCHWCEGEGQQHVTHADILLTAEAGAAVAVRVADCVPILLADPVQQVVAAVHAGWRGTVDGAVSAAIAAMQERGSQTAHILASIGPCIGPCCFEIDGGTAARLRASVAGGEAAVQEAEVCHADLALLNRLQLLQAGVQEASIENLSRCTRCHPEKFFSYRRDRGETGRMLGIVALP